VEVRHYQRFCTRHRDDIFSKRCAAHIQFNQLDGYPLRYQRLSFNQLDGYPLRYQRLSFNQLDGYPLRYQRLSHLR